MSSWKWKGNEQADQGCERVSKHEKRNFQTHNNKIFLGISIQTFFIALNCQMQAPESHDSD